MSNNDGVFLYVGIVAIWAGFLIPAWIRRPHAAETDADDLADDLADDTDEIGGHEADDIAEDGAYEGQTTAEAVAPEYCEQMPDYVPTGRSDRPPAADWEPATGPPPVTDRATAAGRQLAYGRPAADGRPSAYGPSQSRQQMLRARRRMLAILVTLSVVTCGFFVLGLVRWWICVPPVALLVLYALLLREIAMADAEVARKRAAWESRAARAHAAREQLARDEQLARQRYQGQHAARITEQDAEIIDISGRVGDQLYDQYADAAVRAVGD